MIEPYGTVLNIFVPKFSAMGLSKSNETSYSMTFSSEHISIEISTENYNHPSISTRLSNDKGDDFSVRVVREILSPDQFNRDTAKLNDLKRFHRLDEVTCDDEARQLGVTEYCRLAIEQLLAFLSLHKQELLTMDTDFQKKYVALENAVLKEIGL